MWILPTRGRAKYCQEVLDACENTGMSTPGLVWVDGWDDSYKGLRLPGNWRMTFTSQRVELCGVLRHFFKNNRALPWYGFISDDNLPRTLGWDRRLAEAAGRWRVAYPDDLYPAREGRHRVQTPVIGGELVRAVGGLTPSWSVHFIVDLYWEHIADVLDVDAYLPDAVVEHAHFSNGKRPMDETYRRVFRGAAFAAGELERWNRHKRSPEFASLLGRATDLMRKEAAT